MSPGERAPLRLDPRFDRLARWSVWLDDAFRIPGTDIRFGWDPVVGLIPGFGDVASPLFTAVMLVQARRMRIPRIVQVRMLMNALLDALLGVVPVLGWIADIGWRANRRNMQLLERHAVPGLPPRRGDVVFVFGVLAVLVMIAMVPFALTLAVIWRIGVI